MANREEGCWRGRLGRALMVIISNLIFSFLVRALFKETMNRETSVISRGATALALWPGSLSETRGFVENGDIT